MLNYYAWDKRKATSMRPTPLCLHAQRNAHTNVTARSQMQSIKARQITTTARGIPPRSVHGYYLDPTFVDHAGRGRYHFAAMASGSASSSVRLRYQLTVWFAEWSKTWSGCGF